MRLFTVLIAIIVFAVGCATKTTVIKTHPTDNAPQSIKHSKAAVSDNHLVQGKRLYFKGKFNQATKHLIRSIANNRENWESYYYLGLTQQKKNRYDRAIGSFNNSLKHAPVDREIRAKINYALGVCWEHDGYFVKASDNYNRAIKLNPDYTQAKIAAQRVKDKALKAEAKKKKKTRNKTGRTKSQGFVRFFFASGA
jgi:tetratricopeptide (TPR) repeat protein